MSVQSRATEIMKGLDGNCFVGPKAEQGEGRPHGSGSSSQGVEGQY